MLSVELKKGDKPGFGAALRGYIKSVYGEDPEIYADDLKALDTLRTEIMSTGPSAVDKMLQYAKFL